MVILEPTYAPVDQWDLDDSELGKAIQSMVRQIERHDRRWDRRDTQRQAFPCMFELIPADAAGTPFGEAITVVGKDISPTGIHFFHRETMPYQFMLMSIISPTGMPTNGPQILIKLRWCRFLRPGWYDSGGQFVKAQRQSE